MLLPWGLPALRQSDNLIQSLCLGPYRIKLVLLSNHTKTMNEEFAPDFLSEEFLFSDEEETEEETETEGEGVEEGADEEEAL